MPILRRITNRLVRAGTQALFSAVNRPGGRFHLVSRPTWHWTMPDWDTVHAIARLDDPRGADLIRLYALHANIRRVLDAGVPGALAEAVDGFCAGRQVRPVILPDASGTCIIAIPAAQAESERARSTT
ncbi:hypothetical protein [Desulfobaculum sp.]